MRILYLRFRNLRMALISFILRLNNLYCRISRNCQLRNCQILYTVIIRRIMRVISFFRAWSPQFVKIFTRWLRGSLCAVWLLIRRKDFLMLWKLGTIKKKMTVRSRWDRSRRQLMFHLTRKRQMMKINKINKKTWASYPVQATASTYAKTRNYWKTSKTFSNRSMNFLIPRTFPNSITVLPKLARVSLVMVKCISICKKRSRKPLRILIPVICGTCLFNLTRLIAVDWIKALAAV